MISSSGTGVPSTSRLGRYHLAELLGGGPNGEVYRAKVYGVAGFERQFAVKRFHADLVREPQVAAQVAAAARMYGSLEHPRVARLHEFGVAGGETFTAVELVEGLDGARLALMSRGRDRPLSAGAVASILSQAARAVGYAHGRGLCHLGICPTNLLCTPDGEARITDFGFLPARLPKKPHNDPTLDARTPYLAPEQLVGEPTSPATDVFQLGLLAYELFTGTKPFRGATAFETAQLTLSARPPEPDLPPPMAKVLQRALARSPQARFPDAAALADAIDAAVRATPMVGDQGDVARAVQDGLREIQAMHDENASGMLSFPLPAAPRRTVLGHLPPGGPRPDARPPRLTPTEAEPVASPDTPPFNGKSRLLEVEIDDDDVVKIDDDDDTQISRRRATGNSAGWSQVGGESVVDWSEEPAPPPALMPPPVLPPMIEQSALPLPSGVGSSPLLAPPRRSGASSPPPPPPPAPGGRHEPPGTLPGADRGARSPEIGGAEPLVRASELGRPRRSIFKTVFAMLALAVLCGGIGVGAYFGLQYVDVLLNGGEGGEQGGGDGVGAGGGEPQAGSIVEEDATPTTSREDAAAADAGAKEDGAVAAASGDAGGATATADAGGASPPADGGAESPPADAGVSPPGDGKGGLVEQPAPAGKLVIESEPEAARVYLDGALVGKTPLELDSTADRHKIAVVKPGYKLFTDEVVGGGKISVKLEEVTPTEGPAGIKVRCTQKQRYYVFVDGHDVGQLCPTERIGVQLGSHTVEIYDPVTDSRKAYRVEVEDTHFSVRVRVD